MTAATGGPAMSTVLSFPRQQARTRRFSLGAPRNFTVSPDGERVAFLRSPAGDDPATSLWVYDLATGLEREVAGPVKPWAAARRICRTKNEPAANALANWQGA